MRRTLFALMAVFVNTPLFAGPAPTLDDASPASAPTREAFKKHVKEYAAGVVDFARYFQQSYVRELSATDLVEAAIGGLYDAVQISRPANLRSRLKPPVPLKTPLWEWLIDVLVAFRENFGDLESLRGGRAFLVSLQAMTKTLDPYSVALAVDKQKRLVVYEPNTDIGLDLPEDYRVLPEVIQPACLGINGGSVGSDDPNFWPIVIRGVASGSPAQKAGLRPGDGITHIDGKETKGLSRAQVWCRISGQGKEQEECNASFKLIVRPRGGDRPRAIMVGRGRFAPETVFGVIRNPDNSWDYWIDRKHRIAHVRISRFAAEELRDVVEQLDAGNGLGGLILDLRWTPDAYLASAIDCAEIFLKKDAEVARTKSRMTEEKIYYATPEGRPLTRFPIVVLVNGDTVGGGEMLAAALQDHKRAVVVGERTRGKGSIEEKTIEFDHLEMPFSLTLTTTTFIRPSGKAMHRFANSKPGDDWGVRPDEKLECVLSPALNRQLREWWEEQTLRPGSSNKALSLDDPENDPQRQAALKALLRLVK